MISITNTTSTGAGSVLSGGPFSKVAVFVPAVTGGTGSVSVEGSYDGVAWTAVVAATTFTAAGVTKLSTGLFLYPNVRARLAAWGSTNPAVVHVVGA